MSYETSSAISKPSIKRTRENADVVEVSTIFGLSLIINESLFRNPLLIELTTNH